MRITFRTKIFLCLAGTVGVLLVGALAAVERFYAAQVDEQIGYRVTQGDHNFDAQAKHLWKDLLRTGEHLADTQRLKGALENPGRTQEVRGIALNEIESQQVEADFLVITDGNGKPLLRDLSPPGARHVEGQKPPLEARAIEGGKTYPEDDLVRSAVRGETLEDPGRPGLYVVDEGRLFQVGVFPIEDVQQFRGVLVLGTEVSDRLSLFMHTLQADPLDGTGYVVGDRLAVCSLDRPAREAARTVLTRALAGRARGDAHVTIEAVLRGIPYRIVLHPIHDVKASRPIYTALFLSLGSIVEARGAMRWTLLSAAALGVAFSLLLSSLFSRGVSKPVRDLVVGTERISRGDYAHRVGVRSRDELGDLAVAFNRMAGDLAQKEKIRGVLNKVVAKEVADELLAGDLGLGGRQVRATLLFADLRGFTAMTQGMNPQAVVAMLNEYMTAMSGEIFACKGIVDKYVGDEIIGVFGAPKSYGTDALGAVEAACRMRSRLERLNVERARRGERPLAMGVGVHTGEVVAGCMGSEQLLNYTCIGETVNLASRLCSNAKAGQILASAAAVREAGPRVDARPLDPIRVKGFAEPVAVAEIAGVRSDL